MPTKHIDAELWQKVEEKTVETIMKAKVMVKETEVLQEIIKKGLQHISIDELEQHALSKKQQKDNHSR